MPKVKKNRKSASAHAPLGQQINDDEASKKFAKSRRSEAIPGEDNNDDAYDQEEVLDPKTSKRILDLASEQQIHEERKRIISTNPSTNNNTTVVDDSDSDASDSDHDFSDDEDVQFTQSANGGYVSVSGPGLTDDEERIVSAMLPEGARDRRTLADIIMDKIAEKEERMNDEEGEGEGDDEEEVDMFPPKVVEVYTGIGAVLSRYTAGKLPKAFKVIPSLQNWEDVLYLTRPDKWTPQAMFAATRIFASNLNPAMAQRFYNLILLDAVRADIMANKTLNYHYYMSLKKALYKPSAFYKGVLLPLCKSGCTLREAAIVSSVLAKVSIPVHHSAVAIHKLGGLPYSGAASVFIKTLLGKKYSLPVPVIEGLVVHFKTSADVGSKEGGMPVLWHQALLEFAERYKNSISKEGKQTLKVVLKMHHHKGITPAVRRELFGWEDEK